MMKNEFLKELRAGISDKLEGTYLPTLKDDSLGRLVLTEIMSASMWTNFNVEKVQIDKQDNSLSVTVNEELNLKFTLANKRKGVKDGC